MFQITPLSSKSVRIVIVLASLLSLSGLTTLVRRSRSNTSAPAALRQRDSERQSKQKIAYGQLPLSFEVNRGQTDVRVNYLARGSGYSLFLTPAEAVLALNSSSDHEITDEDAGLRRHIQRRSSGSVDTAAAKSVLSMKVIGASTVARVSGEERLVGKSNYFIGKDPRKWQRGVANFARVKYQAIYPGIDLVYYGNQRQLEYDFVVQPGSDPRRIALAFEGADQITVDDNGELVLKLAGKEIRQHKPLVYQDINGTRQEIASRYALKENHQISFELGSYDLTKPLVIDPVLVYSTYFGGAGFDSANGIAVNSSGEAYITGTTASLNFPGTPVQKVAADVSDAFVVKLNSAGTAVLYASYFGGDNRDFANAIAVDSSGNAYVTGSTHSYNFPTAGTPFQAAKTGGNPLFKSTDSGANFGAGVAGGNASGLTTASVSAIAVHPTNPSLVFATPAIGASVYKSVDGGSTWTFSGAGLPDDFMNDITFNSADPSQMYAAANGNSFGTPAGGVYRSTDGGNNWSQTSITQTMNTVISGASGVIYAGGFDGLGVWKSIDGVNWSNTIVGDVEADGDADGFGFAVSNIIVDPANSQVIYVGTDAGGIWKSTDGGASFAMQLLNAPGYVSDHSLSIDSSNTLFAVVDGQLQKGTGGGSSWTIVSTPVTAGGFATSTLCVGSSLYLGTSQNGIFKSINSGVTWSPTSLTTNNIHGLVAAASASNQIYAEVLAGSDGFVAKFSPNGSTLVYSTYLGGSRPGSAFIPGENPLGIVVDSAGNAYVTGSTNSIDFPLQDPIQATFGGLQDVFVAKLNSTGSALSFATYLGGSINDAARGIALAPNGSIYVAGNTGSPDYPLANAAQSTYGGAGNDGFLTRLNPSGGSYSIGFSTFAGGPGGDVVRGVATDAAGNAYIAGNTNSIGLATAGVVQPARAGQNDGFVAKYDQNGARSYLTYLGGSLQDFAMSIAVDPSGNASVAGYTASSNFPQVNSLQAFGGGTCGALNCNDAFVVRLNATGTARAFSTYLGGSSNDQAFGIALDASNSVYVAGLSSSTEIKPGAIQGTNGGGSDAFITKLASVPDLSVNMTDSPDPVGVNSILRYTATVTNAGETNLTGVMLSDTLPANTSYVSATSSQGTCNGTSVVTCPLGNLSLGQTVTITILVKPSVASPISNTVSVNANESEPNMVNNSSTQATTVTAGTTYTVNSTADASDGACAALGTGNGCTLREAINAANSSVGVDTIRFNIPAGDAGFNGSVFTIRPLSPLPALTDSGTTIDGATQTSFNGNTNVAGPEVVINGGLMGFSAPFGGGLNVSSSGNHIHNLVINGFNNTGISITGAGATGNLVTGCFLGTNAAGNGAAPNSFDGITVSQGASNNVVGGITLVDRNLIAGNSRNGITILFAGTNSNFVLGNIIGTDITGTTALGNGSEGVQIGPAANGNLIGGTNAGARNLISGNGGDGVGIIDPSSAGNQVQGNFIGTNAAGGAAVGNGGSGVQIRNSGTNTIGGMTSGSGNLVSGNHFNGVEVLGGSNNRIQGNIIGSNLLMSASLPNSNGVALGVFLGAGATNNIIGGDDDDDGILDGVVNAGNKIFGNQSDGVVVFSAFDNGVNAISSGNTIQGNLIGGSALLMNSNNGISLHGATNNLIGGLTAGAGNTIAFNAAFGVVLTCPTLNGITVCSVGNQILSNSIYAHNNAPGIALLQNAGNFANNNQSAPTLFNVGVNGGSANFGGKLTSTPNSNYRIQVFSNDNCNPSGNGEGQRLVATTTASSDGSGVAFFSVNGAAQIGEFITATATDINTNNTSRFSPCMQAVPYQSGTLQFSLANYAVTEGAGNALIVVTRSGDNSGSASVQYTTSDGSAVAGSEYTPASGTLSFAAGDNFKSFVVPISDDGVVEPVKSLNLALSNALGSATLGTQTSATLSIADNDPAPQAGNVGKIAFQSVAVGGDGAADIFVMNADGSNRVNLTNSPESEEQPAWSPDGTKLAFLSDRNGGVQIFTMNADGTNVVQISDNSMDHYTPTWSPDGNRILFEGDNDLFIANADGTNLIRLSNTPGFEANTDWSPDGSKILLTSNRDNLASGANGYELYVMNADGTNIVRLTNNTVLDNWGRWSPDGTKIIFHSRRNGDPAEIFIMNADGSNPVNLSNNLAQDTLPSLSPDGTQVAFTTNRDGRNEIYSMNVDGSGVTRLTNTANEIESFARWQPVQQKQNQTITFDALANKTYGNAPFTVTATASSNLPVTFSVVSGPATIAGNMVTLTGAGPVTIRATQAGDSTYNSATADRSFTVSAALLSVIADSKTRVYGAANPTLTVHYSGFVNNENPGVLAGSLSVNTTANQSSGIGSYNITPIGYTSNNYTIQYVDATLTIDQAATTTASGNYSLLVPGNVNLSAQVTPDAPSTQDLVGGTVTFVIRQGTTTVGTVTSGPVSNGQASANFNIASAGAYTIYASYSGTANYFGSTGIASLTVGNANPIPSVTGVTPDSAVKKPTETGQFTLLIDGNGFMSTLNGDPANSSVDWYDPTTGQHTVLALTSTTGVQIQAVVPFTLIRDGKTVEVRINNPGPGGGTSNAQPFFITDTTATVTSADTVIPNPTTGNASTTSVTPSGAVLSAEASSGGSAGSGTLTVAQYSADPIGTNSSPNSSAFSTAEGTGYFDVYVAPGSSFTSLTLEYSNTGGTALYWWDGAVWAPASNQSYNPTTGTITVTVTTSSSPSIAQLTGTVFGVATGPAINSIVVTPSATVALGSGAITLNAQFSDPGGGGPYTAQANWGDAQITNLNVSGTTLTGVHSYTAAGTYAITVRVSRGDKFGTSTFSPLVVFDASVGFLTGGGWFNSPLGALPAQPGFTGKVQFESSVKYEPGTVTPTGLTKVSLPSREFRSTSFSSLSITGSRVLVFGTGTINGSGSYRFLLSGIDGKLEGKKLSDKLRVRIWNPAGGAVIYDSQLDAMDGAAATVVLGGGNITIHK
ncbi:MAG TPA: hypothetical protein DC047_11850 [Blastocatellia bacterium]|nr:hypothetical protein [Blastocatellia bacterium]